MRAAALRIRLPLMTLAHPGWLFLAMLAVAFVAWVFRAASRRRAGQALVYSNLAFARDALRPARLPGRALFAGFLLAACALAVSVAGPHFVASVPSHDTTVVLCIDTSGSMRSEDVDPTRAQAAQSAARAFVDSVPSGTRIGLVTFSTGAIAQLAPTSDLDAVRDAIDRIPPPDGATAIGDALQLAAQEMPVKGARVIVLLTDGVNNRGADPLSASRTIGAQGVRIETIGVGSSDSGQMIPGTSDPAELDVTALRTIAQNGSGEYVGASDAGQLRDAFRGLARATVWQRQRVDGSLPFALGGGVLMLATFLAALGAGRL